jgi:hypothetical protein
MCTGTPSNSRSWFEKAGMSVSQNGVSNAISSNGKVALPLDYPYILIYLNI